MSKGLESRKNQKKKPTMTLKERRQKKHEKKHQQQARDFHHEVEGGEGETPIVM
jgi:hypothetical protein